MAKYNWNGMYRPNMFTPDNDKDQLVDVNIAGSVKDDDIVNDIAEEGSELNKATLSDVIKRYQKAVMKRVLNGYAYSNDFVQMQPRISGVFESDSAQFDPSIHKCTMDMSVGTALRGELANVGVKILGSKDSGGAKISKVTDSETDKVDELTINEMCNIEGAKIKIFDPADEEQGVFFVDAAGKEHRVATKIVVNKVSQLMVKVPKDLEEGTVQLLVRTRFSGGGDPLKTLRTVKYNHDIKLVK